MIQSNNSILWCRETQIARELLNKNMGKITGSRRCNPKVRTCQHSTGRTVSGCGKSLFQQNGSRFVQATRSAGGSTCQKLHWTISYSWFRSSWLLETHGWMLAITLQANGMSIQCFVYRLLIITFSFRSWFEAYFCFSIEPTFYKQHRFCQFGKLVKLAYFKVDLDSK